MLQFPVLFPTSIIYYFFLYSIALFPTQAQLKKQFGGCIIFKGFGSLLVLAVLSVMIWDFWIFPSYDNANLSDVFSKIFRKTVDTAETNFLIKCMWVSWIWTLFQVIESCFQLAWWIKLLKYADYFRTEQENAKVEEDDGMTYSTNQLNPERAQKVVQHDDLFDDSDSSEEIIETSLSTKKNPSKKFTGHKSRSSTTTLASSNSNPRQQRQEKSQSDFQQQEVINKLKKRLEELQNHIDSELQLSGDVNSSTKSNPHYSKQNIMDRMMKEDDEDQEQLDEIRRQQKLLLASQKSSKKAENGIPPKKQAKLEKTRNARKKQPIQEEEEWDSEDDGVIYNVDEIKDRNISSLKEKMEIADRKAKSSKVEIDF